MKNFHVCGQPNRQKFILTINISANHEYDETSCLLGLIFNVSCDTGANGLVRLLGENHLVRVNKK